MTAINLAPKTIWTGLTVPGKKMSKVLVTAKYMEPQDGVLALYKSSASTTLLMTAAALYLLPEFGAIGPALRDLRKPIVPGAGLFGAVLTDIRDFLKLRFGVSGAELARGDTGSETPESVVVHVIHTLDELSRDRDGHLNVQQTLSELVALLRSTSRRLDPYRGRIAASDEASDRLEAEMFGGLP